MVLRSREFALKAVRLLNEKKASEISLLELSKVSIIADYFIICEGTSKIQSRAICDHLLENLPDDEHVLLRLEGYQEARWILLDYGDLIVHIFLPEEREFYNLERLWGKAETIPVNLESSPNSS